MNTFKKLCNLKNRIAIVTGATGHLGIIICETLAELGADLILIDLPNSNFTKLQKDLDKIYKTKSIAVPCDLEFEEQRKKMINRVKKQTKKLNILINNAAFVGTSKLKGWNVSFNKQTLNTWRRAIELNLTTPFHLSQAFAPELKKQNGNIINISSIYGEFGPDRHLYQGTEMANPAGYGASKGGLLQLTRYLSAALAPEIRVNAISGGGIYRNQSKIFLKNYAKKTLLNRMAYEIDFCGAVAFLATDASKYVTGQNIRIDGGFSVI
jgi:NAD(P)-dependent dehydrogenase (short-subunit alcohol dehydrogenase family)